MNLIRLFNNFLQLDVGHIILKKQKHRITNEVESYSKRLFECIIQEFYKGPGQCMIDFWISKGYTYPWIYPDCY